MVYLILLCIKVYIKNNSMALAPTQTTTLTSQESSFLIAEYNASWEQIFRFDARRSIFLRYYTIVTIAILGLCAGVFEKFSIPKNIDVYTFLDAILLLAIVAGGFFLAILSSERAANIRYRTKINIIREIFLKNSNNQNIKLYLEQNEIGVKLFSLVKQPSGDGRTLKYIYHLIYLQQFIMAMVFGYILLEIIAIQHYAS